MVIKYLIFVIINNTSIVKTQNYVNLFVSPLLILVGMIHQVKTITHQKNIPTMIVGIYLMLVIPLTVV